MSVDTDGLQLITEGFGLTPKGRGLLIRIGWVAFVSIHILWVCGWLSWAGLASPFAKAEDFAELSKNARLTATISIVRELRDEYAARCNTTDPGVADKLDRYIDVLQSEFYQLTGKYFPDPGCPHEHGR